MANLISGVLNVAKTALNTQQKALDITATNIANVNTDGYSRQRITMEQNEPVRYPGGTFGTGVRANPTIQRMYDRFLAAQITAAASQQGRWEAQREVLEKVELMVDEVSGYGLNAAMADFWNAWQDLANQPSGYAERATLLANAQNLTRVFNQLSSNLNQVRADSDTSITATLGDINRLTARIAELNLNIASLEANGQHSANTFRDQRDLALKSLSSLIEVNSFEDAHGYLTITTATGHSLVDRSRSWDLAAAANADGLQDVFWQNGSGAPHNITADIAGGKLKGWLEARDTIVPDYLARLDDVAVALASAVNSQHGDGIDLTAAAGLDFFSSATAAGTLAVNQTIVNDINRIAAAASTENIPGGNGNAIAMAQIPNQLLMGAGSATIDGFYNALVGDLGRSVSQAQANTAHQSMVSLQLATYREEVSGVSLDEEMVNMIQFQSAYSAAAKLVSTVDEMLRTLIDTV